MGDGFKMPGWVRDNASSVEREAAPYRSMSPSERLSIVDSLCRDAIVLLAGRDDRDRVLAFRDPLPQSSREALARLRAAERAGRKPK